MKGDGDNHGTGGDGIGVGPLVSRGDGGNDRSHGCGYGRDNGDGFTWRRFHHFSLGLLCLDPKDLKCLLIQSKTVVGFFKA